MKDCNGKNIYVNDLVRILVNKEDTYKVVNIKQNFVDIDNINPIKYLDKQRKPAESLIKLEIEELI